MGLRGSRGEGSCRDAWGGGIMLDPLCLEARLNVFWGRHIQDQVRGNDVRSALMYF